MSKLKEHWQQVYRDKSSLDVSWYQKEPTLSLEFIHHCNLHNDDAIIDIGGGASTLVDHLYKDGFTNLSVLDISANALSSSKQRLGDSASNIQWLEADITEFSPPQTYSLWHDRAVFHFLTKQSDREKYISTLNNSLRPGGHLIIAAFAIGGPVKCSGLDIVQYDSSKLMTVLGDDFTLVSETSETHLTPSSKKQKFGYFYFKKVQR